MTPNEAWDSIVPILQRIEDPATCKAYLEFHTKHTELAVTMPASVSHHHAWPGGYAIHLAEVMANMQAVLYSVKLPSGLGFTRADAITSAYVHDLDKLLYRYERDKEPPTAPQLKLGNQLGVAIDSMETKKSISEKIDAKIKGLTLDSSRISRHAYREEALAFEDGAIVMKLCSEHGLPLSTMALHAVCVAHGGYSALARTTRNLDIAPLGCFLHVADYISSNVQLGNVDVVPKSGAFTPPTPPPVGPLPTTNAFEQE